MRAGDDSGVASLPGDNEQRHDHIVGTFSYTGSRR